MLWLKALHIIFMVTWFAGLFYLPRIYVYLSDTADEATRSILLTMARRLYGIMTIGMVATWVFGLWLIFTVPVWGQMGWLHAKLVMVVALSGYHGWLKLNLRKFDGGSNPYSGRFWRIANEVPAVALVAIVLLATLKPF